ncbi:MAG: cytochrome C [Pseudomonadota bacterium]
MSLVKDRRVALFAIVSIAFVATACGSSQSTEFTLPEGDADRGKQTFIDLGCGFCHSVSGVEGLREDFERPERNVVLGGEKDRLYSYGELVTSIINPSHKISQPELGNVVDDEGNSQMVNYNDIMTVTEMTDLVTFLEQHYSLKPFERTHYSPYYPY